MNTSKRANSCPTFPGKNTLSQQPFLSRLLALLMFFLASGGSIKCFGLTAGLFTALLLYLTVASALLLLFPFRYLTMTKIMLLFIVAIGFELTVFPYAG
ncbi:hypothetical protein ACL9RF_05905 [Sphingobacterium sp. Mn56C]|uniref:hypothetical protein n=1 Tax=Sphingobacterium sp. Mn56C TaxID=3395261 RepID=UPI003BE7C7B0